MTEQSFALLPFPAPNLPEIAITGIIARQDHLLSLHYSLSGKLKEIILPSLSSAPRRKGELWTATCCEFFFSREGAPDYWEFNLSPSGDWNVYHMDAYRRIGFREETRIERLSFEVRKEMNAVTLNAAVDLDPILQPDDLLEVGITAVIQANDGSETYWALTHPGSQADFHLRQSFTLLLAEQTHPLKQSVLRD